MSETYRPTEGNIMIKWTADRDGQKCVGLGLEAGNSPTQEGMIAKLRDHGARLPPEAEWKR